MDSTCTVSCSLKMVYSFTPTKLLHLTSWLLRRLQIRQSLISHVFSPTTCGMSFDPCRNLGHLHSALCGGEHCHTIVQKNEIAVMSAKFCRVRSFDASFWKPLFENLPFEDPKHPLKASPSKPPSEACLRSHLRRSAVKPSLETLLRTRPLKTSLWKKSLKLPIEAPKPLL